MRMRTRTRVLRQQRQARQARQLRQRQQMFSAKLAQEQTQMNQAGGIL